MNIDLRKLQEPNSNLIPENTIAECRLTIIPGGYYTDVYTDGYATKSKTSEAVYLNVSYEILDAEYKNRVVRSNIGLFSPKIVEPGKIGYADMGLLTMRNIILSAYNLDKKSQDERLDIKSYKDLDGLICICKITKKTEEYKGEQKEKNDIVVLTPSSVLYQEFKLQNNKPVTSPVKQVQLIDDEIPF